MTHRQAVFFLEHYINYENIPRYKYEKSFNLLRIKNFLSILGSPQKQFRIIHVAGSKGKGSTCAFIAYILKEAGFKVGLYTSPHLNDFRERIRVLPGLLPGDFEGMITGAELGKLTGFIRPLINRFNRHSRWGKLTFFEICTALALIYFKRRGIDFAVLETGLGGRLDATNAVISDLCVITPISYEHTDKLGKSLKDIAFEKSGIIKHKGAVVISAPQERTVLSVLRKRCRSFGARLIELKGARAFNIKLLGRHQCVNAAVAAKAVQSLSCFGFNVGIDVIKKGLYNTLWPGRCEVIHRRPLLVIDGAQNVASVKALKEAVRNNFSYNKLILVLGLSSDKDVRGISAELFRFADEIIITKSQNPRAMAPQNILKQFQEKGCYITMDTDDARKLAFKISGRKDLILVTGSLFVAGEFRRFIRHEE